MANTDQLSRLMRISWDIQRNRKKTRSKSLQAVWAIFNNEEIALQYVLRRLNGGKKVTPKAVNQYALFN